MPKKPFQQRRGYVLVMTLVVIGVAGLALARLTQRGLSLTLEARLGEKQLQQRWAVLSCQLLALRDPGRKFGDLAASFEQAALGWPHPASVQGVCQLGGVECRLLLADEQAKANLNAIQRRRPEMVTPLLAGATRGANASIPVRLRPSQAPDSRRNHRYFESWGQIVDVASLENPGPLLATAQHVTCWGEPRLNVSRASDEAVEAIARLAMTGPELNRLLEERVGFEGELDELLKLAEIPRRKTSALKRLLTDRSRCYSLWLVTHQGGHTALHVTIDENGGPDRPSRRTLVWP